MTIPIPVNDVYVPEAHLDWIQEAYTNTLLNAIDTHIEEVDDRILNLWTMWDQEQDSLWAGGGFDLVTAMGYSNVTLPAREKDFAYQRNLYEKAKAVGQEAIRGKTLQLYISAKFAMEKQRQADYVTNGKLYQRNVKYNLDAEVARNDTELKKFEGRIEGETIRLKQAIAIVERVERNIDLAVRLLEAQGDVLIAEGRNELEREKLNVTLAKAALDVKLANLEAQKALVQADLIRAQIDQLEAQVRVIEAEEIVEEGRKYDLLADIATIQAQARQIEILREELNLITAETAALTEIANIKQSTFNAILAEKTAMVGQLSAALNSEIMANHSYATSLHSASTARLGKDLAEDNLKMAEETNRAMLAAKENEGRMTELVNRAKLEVAQANARFSELAARAKINRAQASLQMNQLIDEARLRAAESRARVSGMMDRASIDAAQAALRTKEVEGQGKTQAATAKANMSKLKAEANLIAAEVDAKMADIVGRIKAAASTSSVEIRKLLYEAQILLAAGEAESRREEGKALAQVLDSNLQAYLRFIGQEMDGLLNDDKVKREVALLDAQVTEAKAHKDAASTMKDAHVENEITEIRK